MDLFNDYVRNAGLVDIPMTNRRYTWSNKRPQPTFSKIDRCFTSTQCQLHFPIICLEALEMVVSDHVPLLLTCRNRATVPQQKKLEVFWLKYEVPKQMVQQLWGATSAQPQGRLQGFTKKTEVLHKALSLWHQKEFQNMHSQLTLCKKAVLFFDRIEERRMLEPHEFQMRCKIKERAFQLANNQEERWRQRARCRWLTQGDKNTRFFHAFASSRARRNAVHTLMHQDEQVLEQSRIRDIFLQQMKGLLGTSTPVQSYNPQALHSANPALQELGLPILETEIEHAVRGLANNKASGPDGIPSEFIKQYWPELKQEVGGIIEGFFKGQTDLNGFNQANIVMIPKIEVPVKVGDFRPISVINVISKIISKIMANRLRKIMPGMISPCQTAFIQGRQITDNFVSTREVLQHISSSKRKAVFIKLDFAKAFDTIEWDFLIRTMIGRGFPAIWINWVTQILSTAESRVLINGEATEFFQHNRGLRQGDPLSPLLFNIAVDVFQSMVSAANQILHKGISRKIKEAMLAYQYADDTAIIASVDTPTLITLS